MKKINIKAWLTLILVSLLYHACDEDRLDLSPLSPTEASFFTEEQDFDRAILGVYAKMSDIYWFEANEPKNGVWQLPGDDVTTTATDAFEIFGPLQSAEGRMSKYYTAAYQLINRANTALQKIDQVKDGVYQTPNLETYHRGEALFMRGLMYFNLWNFFGTSPLVTERIQSTDKISPPGTTGTQLLDQAIADFEAAAGLLPVSWDDANRGRATANAANGMLGKALVFRGTVNNAAADHSSAITAFNKITGVSLVEDFGANFAVDTENNSESLFEYQASQPSFDNVWLNNDFDNAIGSMSAYWGYFENHWSLFGNPPYIATQKLADAFEAGDPRQPLTLDLGDKTIKKYILKDQKSQSGVASVNNPRILRYADVLLLKAEAIVQSGGSVNEAITLINQVRARARNMVAGGSVPADRPATADAVTVMNWVMQERFIELAAEEAHRWFDLRRWHLAGKISLSPAFFSSARTDVTFDAAKHLYYPIPLNELDLNPNVQQNPGY
jgi:tetratricopeptide (TPR) repeat protein